MIGRGRNLAEERDRLVVEVRATEGVRLDHYLLSSLAWKSRSRLQNLIREGRITVNGERVKPSRRVKAGDVVWLELSRGVGVPRNYHDRALEFLYEDDWLVAVNKPPGMLVHPVGRHVYDTLMNYLHHRYHRSAELGNGQVPRLCHRIDRDTTGVLLVAKTRAAAATLGEVFRSRAAKKT